MLAIDRFILHPMQKYTYTDPNCPVRICCSRQCTAAHSGVNFVQVRMQNLSGRFICNIFLTIEAFGANGERLYELRGVVLPECNADNGALFGEDRLIALSGPIADSLTIAVENIVFDDGMLWRKDTIYRSEKPSAPTAPQKHKTADQAAICSSEPMSENQTDETIAEPFSAEPDALNSGLSDADISEATWESKSIDPKIAQIISEPIEKKIERIMGENSHANSEPAVRTSDTPKPEPIVRHGRPHPSPAEDKKNYALWIWLLIILGVAFLGALAYLLYRTGNFSVFSKYFFK